MRTQTHIPIELHLQAPLSKRRQIAEQMGNLIRSGHFPDGTRLPTARDLAASWGSDEATVHHALTELVAQGLLIRRRRAGTFVRANAPKLKSVAIYAVGCLQEERLSPFQIALLAAIQTSIRQAGCEFQMWLDPRDANQRGGPWDDMVRAAQRRDFQGVVVPVGGGVDGGWLQKLQTPISYLDVAPKAPVRIDQDSFAMLSLKAMRKAECGTIGFIGTHGSWTSASGQTFAEAAEKIGIATRDSWFRMAPESLPGTSSAHKTFGYEAFHRIWNQTQRPEGLIVYPDSMVEGVVMGLMEVGVTGSDALKLVFHRNAEIPLLCPLDAIFVESSVCEMANALWTQLLRLHGGEQAEPIAIGHRLSDQNQKPGRKHHEKADGKRAGTTGRKK